jgi:hypothetical protein
VSLPEKNQDISKRGFLELYNENHLRYRILNRIYFLVNPVWPYVGAMIGTLLIVVVDC